MKTPLFSDDISHIARNVVETHESRDNSIEANEWRILYLFSEIHTIFVILNKNIRKNATDMPTEIV